MADIPWGPCTIGYLDRPTSDGRVVASSGLENRTLPLPMDWQEYTNPGHEEAVTVGRMDTFTVDPATGRVVASGVWLDPEIIPAAARARYLADQRIVYPSMEPAGFDVEYRVTGGGEPYYTADGLQESEPYQEVCVFTKFEFAKVTLVSVQAFADLWVTPPGEELIMTPSLTAAGVRSSGWADMPVAGADVEWDGDAAAGRVAEWAGINAEDAGDAEWEKYSRAFLWQDPDADPHTKGAYGFGVADIVDGELTIIPRGVYAVAGVLSGARGGADIPEAQQDRLKSAVRGLYERIASALDDDSIEAPFASLVACAADRPPLEWFQDPKLTEPTPIEITPDGRIFGHIGIHGMPHRGLGGRVTIPKSKTQYREFLLGGTLTAEGVTVPTGKITLGGGHAADGVPMQLAAEHYDDVSCTVATVAAGDDAFGVWISGAIKPGTDAQKIEDLRESPPSGDWREDHLGNLELITVHSVNSPGFAVYRVKVGEDDQGRYGLTASSALVRLAQRDWRARKTAGDGYVRQLASELAPLLRESLTADAAPAVVSEMRHGFDLNGDLRVQFDAAGIPWPTISADVNGVAAPAFDVAPGCVRGMLAAMPEPDPGAALALKRAQAKLRMLTEG